MKKNMSATDRTIRTLIAIVFFLLYGTGVVGNTLGVILLIVGIVFILTSVVGFCPLYAPFGITTMKRQPEQ